MRIGKDEVRILIFGKLAFSRILSHPVATIGANSNENNQQLNSFSCKQTAVSVKGGFGAQDNRFCLEDGNRRP
jgi:hypothetical protein